MVSKQPDNTLTVTTPVRGSSVSGRKWKRVQTKRASSVINVKPFKTPFAVRTQQRLEKKQLQAYQKQLRDEAAARKEAEKQARKERKERQEENTLKNQITQKVCSRKVKRMTKKQLRNIIKQRSES